MDVSDAKRPKAQGDEKAKLLAKPMLDAAAVHELRTKKCTVCPVHARVGDDDSSCMNVSGLSRVDCCCSQAMMRSADAVPNKWFGHEARFLHRAYGMLIHCFDIAVPGSRNRTGNILTEPEEELWMTAPWD